MVLNPGSSSNPDSPVSGRRLSAHVTAGEGRAGPPMPGRHPIIWKILLWIGRIRRNGYRLRPLKAPKKVALMLDRPTTREGWLARAAALTIEGRAFIGGAYVPAPDA